MHCCLLKSYISVILTLWSSGGICIVTTLPTRVVLLAGIECHDVKLINGCQDRKEYRADLSI